MRTVLQISGPVHSRKLCRVATAAVQMRTVLQLFWACSLEGALYITNIFALFFLKEKTDRKYILFFADDRSVPWPTAGSIEIYYVCLVKYNIRVGSIRGKRKNYVSGRGGGFDVFSGVSMETAFVC